MKPAADAAASIPPPPVGMPPPPEGSPGGHRDATPSPRSHNSEGSASDSTSRRPAASQLAFQRMGQHSDDTMSKSGVAATTSLSEQGISSLRGALAGFRLAS